MPMQLGRIKGVFVRRTAVLSALLSLLVFYPMSHALGEDFQLKNGDVFKGELVTPNDQGIVVRLDIGGFSERIWWSKLTQETLQKVMRNQDARKFAAPFLEPTRQERQQDIVFRWNEVPEKIENAEPGEFAQAITTPVGYGLLGLVLLASIYAGAAIAPYRNQPTALVCAVSAILPGLGPLLFLSMPTRELERPQSAPRPIEDDLGQHEAPSEEEKSSVPPPAGGGLKLGGRAAADSKMDTNLYSHSDTEFSRRFFETKFPSFFRMTPRPEEKDFMLHISTVKNSFRIKRISRITGTDLYAMMPTTGAQEQKVPFSEITTVQVKHKDDK